MSEAVAAPNAVAPKVGRALITAIAMALAITAVGLSLWLFSIRLNLRVHPELPWAAMTTLCALAIMVVWLSGAGWPMRTSAFRRFHLRMWRPEPGAWSGAGLVSILGLSCSIAGLYALWILTAVGRAPADLSIYPTTSLRFTLLIMTPLVAAVVEEVAFRGYMQSHLERIGPTFAILVTSVAFALAHITHGLEYLLVVAPGIFFASVVYGYLALKSGSILPGMALHFVGDLSYAYFVQLDGDASRLFAN